jgi:DUF1680 family protein
VGPGAYRPDDETATEASDLRLVPYFAWDNREPVSMDVWVRSA